jgi:hypothetical protein
MFSHMNVLFKSILLIVPLFLCVQAQEAGPDRVVVQSLKPDLSLSAIQGAFEKRESGTDKLKASSTLPDPKARDSLFEKIGITRQVKLMDHLDRDLLYLKLKRYEVAKLLGEYSWLKGKQIEQFKLLVNSKVDR